MSNTIFINIILIEIALVLFMYMWKNEIINSYYIIRIYITIFGVSVLWILHFGNESYRITYRKPKDEIGIYRVIDFPAVWF